MSRDKSTIKINITREDVAYMASIRDNHNFTGLSETLHELLEAHRRMAKKQ